MDSRWLWVVLSTVALIGGFSILLVCINMFAVPHMLTGNFLPTVCTLVSIQISGGKTSHVTTPLPKVDDTESKFSNDENQNRQSSEVVKRYTDSVIQEPSLTHNTAHNKIYPDEDTHKRHGKNTITDKTPAIAYNHQVGHLYLNRRQTDSSGVQHRATAHWTASSTGEFYTSADDVNVSRTELMMSPVCVKLKVKYKDRKGQVMENGEVFGSAWSYYRVLHGPEKCHCAECLSEDKITVTLQDLQLFVGDTFPCLYNPQETSHVLTSRNSIGFVLNMMLWPTLIFIIGFVGLVFACLYVQRDDWSTCRCRNYSFYWV